MIIEADQPEQAEAARRPAGRYPRAIQPSVLPAIGLGDHALGEGDRDRQAFIGAERLRRPEQ